jgi:hypothetical protein
MKQMLDTIHYLEAVSADIFNRISARVDEHRVSLQTVQQRTMAAKERVKQVAGRKQATTIFSPTTYPVHNPKLDYPPLFEGKTIEPTYHKFNPGPSALKNVCSLFNFSLCIVQITKSSWCF